jgi:hypothetical protein
MGMLFVSAAVAAALNHGLAMEDPADVATQCAPAAATMTVDSEAGPLLVSLPERLPALASARSEHLWGQAALQPYDVMSSLGAGSVPALPQSLTLADAPLPLPVASPLAWVLAGAGLLAMLYVRRTRP